MSTSHSHVACTQDENAGCGHCDLQGKLACKWDRKVKNCFAAIGFPPVLTAILGMVLVGLASGTWWPLVAYVAYVIAMFTVFEIRFVCSHCPYYADGRKSLRCLGNHGSPKLWRYHPEPMNGVEKLLMIVAVVAMIFFIFPLVVLGYGVWFLSTSYTSFGLLPLLGLSGVAFASLLSSAAFVKVLRTFYCPACVNFSCPLNTVPKAAVDSYLMRNPVMKEAWEKSGYVLAAETPERR